MKSTDARAWAIVDLDALAHNVRTLKALAGDAVLCAVVKANGYGHGAIDVARTALAHGADWLAVAQVAEAVELREAGLGAPVLLLSEPCEGELDELLRYRVRPTVYHRDTLAMIARRADEPVPVHLKVNTGMNRVGVAPADALELARQVASTPALILEGLWTHCAVADEPENPFTELQLGRLATVVSELELAGLRPPLVHAANSAATIAHPGSRLDLVRCGIALHGIAPSPALAGVGGLRPVMSVRSRVTMTKMVEAGEAISYGLRHRFARSSLVATVPVGYADGVRRQLSGQGEVLIGGHRRPIVGVVTMDQIMVDCTDGPPVGRGDEVVLIGFQGHDVIRMEDWAEMVGTIGYEISCGIGSRVARRPVGGHPSGTSGLAELGHGLADRI